MRPWSWQDIPFDSMPWGDGSTVPTSGTDLVIVGDDSNNLLHIRTFDHAGDYIDSFEKTRAA